jgi:hypothetical protein
LEGAPKRFLLFRTPLLVAIGKAGILPDASAEKLLTIAKIAYEEFDSDLREALKKPLSQANKALKRFQHRRSRGGGNTPVHPFLSNDGSPFEWVMSSGFRRRAKELFSDIPLGSVCYTCATAPRLGFADSSNISCCGSMVKSCASGRSRAAPSVRPEISCNYSRKG